MSPRSGGRGLPDGIACVYFPNFDDSAAGQAHVGTILLVDDNPGNLEIYRVKLQYYGYTVLSAVNGEDAVDIAREHQPNLIFMDISMPVMDGLEATRILKADPATSSICIVMLTAHAMTGDRETALATGCNGYLAKPLDPKTLLAVTQRLLGGSS